MVIGSHERQRRSGVKISRDDANLRVHRVGEAIVVWRSFRGRRGSEAIRGWKRLRALRGGEAFVVETGLDVGEYRQ